MKIVIDARELRTTSGRYVERLLHYLQQIDQSHDYIVLLTPKDMPGWQATNPRFVKVLCSSKEFTFSEQIAMYKQIKNINADLVHFPFVQQPILYRGTVVTTMQDLTTTRFRNPTKQWLIFTIKQQVYKAVNRYVARKSKLLITPTKFVQQDVMQFAHIGPGKFTVTYEAADPLPRPAESIQYLQNTKFIMYIGRPLPHKNLWRLVEAFRLLRKKDPSLHLVLAGKKDTAYKRIESRIAAEHIEGVIFTDFVSDASLRWLYEHCRAYIFPSLSEGFGLPGLEAMLHGAPVVSSNATCLPEVYGDAAHYFKPLDVNDIARAITDVLEDERLRKQLIERGHKKAAEYSWKRMAEQTLAVYKKALGK
jgi:glycosyltransferase involved in cell wall biosynthesis